jgi:hypothetical protein
LDETPDNRQELKTLENLQELLVSAYSEGSYGFIEWKTDNAVAIKDNSQYDWMTENFQFKPVVSYEGQDTPNYLWDNNYKAISHSNQVLAALPSIKHNDQDMANAIKGEALISRAYNHFLIASVFCQTYEEASASTDLGIPYITAPETALQVKYERGTLKETYDMVEKDLLEALPLLNDQYFKGSGKYHFNKRAAYAFASRFYLFKKDYEKCIEYSNLLIGAGVPTANSMRNMGAVFSGNNFKEIGAQFIDVQDPSNLLVVRKESGYVTRGTRGYRSDATTFKTLYKETIQVGQISSESDTRYQPWGGSTDARYQPKFPEYFRYITATTGYPYYIHPELRAEEVIFNRMEAYVMTNKTDAALADYNAFAPTRYKKGGQLTLKNITTYYPDGTDQEKLIQFVLDEKRKEFLNEGLRWWDVKRHNLPITHIDVTGDEYKLEAKDLKKAIQIPAKAISQGIQANPR